MIYVFPLPKKAFVGRVWRPPWKVLIIGIPPEDICHPSFLVFMKTLLFKTQAHEIII